MPDILGHLKQSGDFSSLFHQNNVLRPVFQCKKVESGFTFTDRNLLAYRENKVYNCLTSNDGRMLIVIYGHRATRWERETRRSSRHITVCANLRSRRMILSCRTSL